MNGELLPPNGRSARVIEVIEVVTREGDNAHGTLVREVTRYYTLDGELLATRDIDDASIPPELSNTDTWYAHLNATANARMANPDEWYAHPSPSTQPRCKAARPGAVELCEKDHGHDGMHQGGGWIWLPDDLMCESVSSSGARCVLERGHWLAKHQSLALTPAGFIPERW